MKHLDTERPIAYIERTAPGRHAGKRKILIDLRLRKGNRNGQAPEAQSDHSFVPQADADHPAWSVE